MLPDPESMPPTGGCPPWCAVTRPHRWNGAPGDWFRAHQSVDLAPAGAIFTARLHTADFLAEAELHLAAPVADVTGFLTADELGQLADAVRRADAERACATE